MTTVCNTGSDANWLATSGAGYRLIADLATNHLLAVDAQSQSGHPGSPHYSDQLAAWSSGKYHLLPLDRDDHVGRRSHDHPLALLKVLGHALPAQPRRLGGTIPVGDREVHVANAVDVERAHVDDDRLLLSEHEASLPHGT